MKFSYLYVLFGIFLGLVAVIVGYRIVFSNYSYQGSLIEPPVQAANFTLKISDGGKFRLSDQKGHVVLIFFGYTNCPDVCPVMLSNFKQIKKQLGENAEEVEFVFITVDPDRDTEDILHAYIQNFDPGFLSLTGSQGELEEVWKSYGVYREKIETGSAVGYLIDHTARIYAIDQFGNWRLTYPFGIEAEKIYQDLIHLLRETGA